MPFADQRASSAPNGLPIAFPERAIDMVGDADAQDESDSERCSEDSDLSSAHANYMEGEEELDSQTPSTDCTSVASALS